jgi:hypothetical protein
LEYGKICIKVHFVYSKYCRVQTCPVVADSFPKTGSVGKRHTLVTRLTASPLSSKLGQEGIMATKRGLQSICSIIALAVLASIPMFALGCNTTEPPNRQVSDVQITTQVKAKLASDVGPSGLTNVDVNTTNGVVTLAGQVENAEVKNKVESVAASVPGVIRVNNDLQVPPAAASVAH